MNQHNHLITKWSFKFNHIEINTHCINPFSVSMIMEKIWQMLIWNMCKYDPESLGFLWVGCYLWCRCKLCSIKMSKLYFCMESMPEWGPFSVGIRTGVFSFWCDSILTCCIIASRVYCEMGRQWWCSTGDVVSVVVCVCVVMGRLCHLQCSCPLCAFTSAFAKSRSMLEGVLPFFNRHL